LACPDLDPDSRFADPMQSGSETLINFPARSVKTVSTAVTAVPASIAKNVDTAIDGITRAFVHKDLRDVLTKILTFPSTLADPGSGAV
jgi:hypothetical protein